MKHKNGICEIDYYQYKLVKDLIGKKQYQLALEKIESLYAAHPENDIFKLMFAKILILHKNGDIDLAYKLLKEMSMDNNVSAMIELGKLEIKRNNLEEAKKIYYHILNQDLGDLPQTIYSLMQLGKINLSTRNIIEAKQNYLRISNIKGCNKDFKDYTKFELGVIEVMEGKYSEAEIHFRELLNTIYDQDARYELIKLLIRKKDYFTALRYIEKLLITKKEDTQFLKKYQTFIKYKLGMFHGKKTEGYFINQLINYDEGVAIEHIKLHLDENTHKVIHSVFNESVDIGDLYTQVKNYIGQSEKETSDAITDIYLIDVGYEIGVCQNYKTSIIKVVTIVDTDKIISMYPSMRDSIVYKSSVPTKILSKLKI